MTLPRRRTMLKWLHWTLLPLVIWFTLVQPKDVTPLGPAAFRFHSVLGLIFVALSLIWFADFLWRGLAGRAGPKLSPRLRRWHGVMHRTIVWGLFLVALTGFLLGLTSPVLLRAGGFLPIAPPLGLARANDAIGTFHTLEFYALAGLIAVHAAFHVWRHLRLRDNALRIMAPKSLHRFL